MLNACIHGPKTNTKQTKEGKYKMNTSDRSTHGGGNTRVTESKLNDDDRDPNNYAHGNVGCYGCDLRCFPDGCPNQAAHCEPMGCLADPDWLDDVSIDDNSDSSVVTVGSHNIDELIAA